MSRTVKCNLCGSAKSELLYPLPGISVLRCRNCGLVFLEAEPTRKQIDEMYNQLYFDDRKDYFFKQDFENSASIRNFKTGLRLLERFGTKGALLDIGCATGVFLTLARQAGWRVTGADVSEYASAYCQDQLGMEVYSGRIGEIDIEPERFDAITLWDVLEHFTDPRSELEAIRPLLKPNGVLLVDTPNERSLIRSLAGLIHRFSGGRIDYPVRKLFHRLHLYYFNPSTLETLLSNTGFELLHLARRPIPLEKGRANVLERLAVEAISLPERMLGREFELVAVARRA